MELPASLVGDEYETPPLQDRCQAHPSFSVKGTGTPVSTSGAALVTHRKAVRTLAFYSIRMKREAPASSLFQMQRFCFPGYRSQPNVPEA